MATAFIAEMTSADRSLFGSLLRRAEPPVLPLFSETSVEPTR
ncbi:MAG: hypothetical protein AB7S61_11340 [Methanoregulaceae archaeon]